MRGVVRAEMFGQLTSGLEAAWNKLKGEGLNIFNPFDRFPYFKVCYIPALYLGNRWCTLILVL